MGNTRITLRQAERFHGHLGPYLALGVLAGELALRKLRCKKYFGLSVKVWGANKKPNSCLIDGLQLSTGATYGKGNIEKLNSTKIKIEVFNCAKNKKIILRFKPKLLQKLREAKTHHTSELLARHLYKTTYDKLFTLTTN